MVEFELNFANSELENKFSIAIKTLLYAAECTLATVEHLQSLKSASKSEIARQIGISNVLLTELKMIGVEDFIDIKGGVCIRVREKLNART